MATEINLPIGVRIQLTGHSDAPVILEDLRPWTHISESRVCLDDRTPGEPVILVGKVATIPAGGSAVYAGSLKAKP